MTTNNATQGETAPARPAGRQGLIKPLRTLLDTSGLIAIFLLLFVALAVLIPDFLTGRNMVGLLLSITLIGSLATTMMLVLALGEVDLSVASTVAFAGVVAAVVTSSTGSVFIGVIGGIVAGGAVGAFNGLVIAKFGINSLIATLAAMEFVRGLAYITSGGDAVMITVPGFFDLGSASFLGLTLPVWTMLACFVIFGVVLNMTAFGRNVLATGGNSEAAALAGVNVRRLKIIVFGLQGVVAGVVGVLLASRMGLGDPNTSMGLELAVISACVLGGVALSGGVATITGVVVGVLIMGCVQNAMGLLNVPTFYQYLVRGAILLLAVMFDRWKQTRRQRA
ncbi:L-arabinose ABC transporter permease AraH [Halomonas sp. ATBC28]|jgi:L-arabinose transport system permease protein|uniref:L-arabinose ABC transporter permease AraH n=2 Tax=Vreelandella TaxID=3137766 RepID=A0A7Z0NCI8_9GAMM|nr:MULTISPECIES: L-arabinose ABC transporter permease AraH [Halomonas]NAO99513.1 L-arabinose ABC transporter permease AraH [Halomonas sp. MG34]QGQ71503.1 L-arabinose ABC transporter permease AraH [Halomonas sp. PA16-9]ELY21269.1 ABC transporter, permease [Halomonas titanicae BH1]KIN13251.1 L-arabinose transporter permease [Halomonas sp. KHS3]MCE7518430.1 L-arabinose ABC transporter permease AraH [Halomonas titanicae]|tara:strand:+ start:5142 stop:6152 length:1011 start_codon:yes stop_codon:yes gene_type:complete